MTRTTKPLRESLELETVGTVSHYKSNLRDIEFNLFELFNVQDYLGTGLYLSLIHI